MGTDELAALLAGWREAGQAATEGPWSTQKAVIAGIGGAYVIEHGEAEIALVDCAGDLRPEQELADAEFIVTARTAMPRLVAAVEAVLKLHQPVTTNGGWLEGREWQECEACGPNNGCEHVIASPGQGESFWPCPTVEAIIAALTGEEASDG